MTYLFLLGRILLGGYYLYNGLTHFKNLKGMAGYAKSVGVPMPELAVGGTGALLVVGGLTILTGAYVTVGVACLMLFFLGVTFKMHTYWKVQDPQQKSMQKLLFMRNIALMGSTLLLLAIPMPWAMSLL